MTSGMQADTIKQTRQASQMKPSIATASYA